MSSPHHSEPHADKVVHDDGSKSVLIEIFLYELGHFSGLEYPWNKGDGDFSVNEWSDAHL